ncbi:hypothetical protein L2D08_07090 [Domibacillus sp. PGB-M46]|uniref:hypothetical protein n=1 Tax=Domibacillus sp. PGB-M46 TaxID=2910255 RepID=UPI001F5AE0FD|nr:hypothetical protein [Domibacillus sp. PGB-M46]MCI2254126.1 hypothetical protein [Domibacillus sp. PGB-M46]
MHIDYQRLYEDYLIAKEERTRQLELDEFQSEQEHMSNWLQKVRGMTAEQAQAVIDHSPIRSQIEEEHKRKKNESNE